MSSSQSEFSPEKPSKSDKKSKSEPKQSKNDKKSSKEQSKPKKVKTVKGEKKEKPAKPNAKDPKKKKQKQQNEDMSGEIKEKVWKYMEEQNRPYNLLNVYDNLHGKIKKPLLQNILDELSEEGKLTSKEVGKIKIYFLNQESLEVSRQKVDSMAILSSELKEKERELGNQHKARLEELKKLMAKKTRTQLISLIEKTKEKVEELECKKEKLTNVDAEKVDEKEVQKIEKEEGQLRRELKKRRNLTKDCLKTWSQALEKKVPVVAEMMGVQL